MFLGEAEDAHELIRVAYEDYISKRAAEEARAVEESLFKLSERVLEQERERLQEILVRYELDFPERASEASSREKHSAPGTLGPSESRKVPDQHETKTGQLLRFRVIETTVPIDLRSGPTEVPTDWHDDLIVDDDRFYIQDRELGLADEGGATASTEMAARRAVLVELERTARRALVAACSADVWPPG